MIERYFPVLSSPSTDFPGQLHYLQSFFSPSFFQLCGLDMKSSLGFRFLKRASESERGGRILRDYYVYSAKREKLFSSEMKVEAEKIIVPYRGRRAENSPAGPSSQS